MKIAFRKIASSPKTFSLKSDGLELSGTLVRVDSQICKLDGRLNGELELVCDRSGEVFMKHFDESLVLYISDGLWDTQSQSKLNSLDVIEFFDGFIDVEYILQSEIESIKMDYHIKGERYGSSKEKSE
ncbi:hypothetical protein [uncultured Helicobacter sp.]|uniref:hypothetical protein n=1 Tax=uncultured Helicobacter sp. TaxID=175537 RepID=UPI00374EBEE0